MLKLVELKKDYIIANQPPVNALKGITLNFRRNEFVAVLGPSGCGKTTLLNLIGGLDRSTDGELIIEGKSTKNYGERDWDTYRNHSIGFVFQTYNLIDHINVLSNVELALTIAGVSKAERKRRAIEALKQVGLEGLEKKKPTQLSGGQMQRVAIARALVNNPEVLLADEPTGALDSETSVQIMEILKEVSKERLVIMVTHNAELADKYASRIINMKDGLVLDDTNPYSDEEEKLDVKQIVETPKQKGKKVKTSMSFGTAFGLSWNNMMTKKGRTLMTAFAGSIGIIGIALVLSVSFGFNNYISAVQKETMYRYPIAVEKHNSDYAVLLETLTSEMLGAGSEKNPHSNIVTEDTMITDMLLNTVNSQSINDTKSFVDWYETKDVQDKYAKYIDSTMYQYYNGITVYSHETEDSDEVRRIYPIDLTYGDYEGKTVIVGDQEVPESIIVTQLVDFLDSQRFTDTFEIYSQLIPTKEYLKGDEDRFNQVLMEEYDIVYGNMPTKMNEVVIIVDHYNKINDYMLYGLGLKSPQHLVETLLKTYMNAEVDIVEEEEFETTYKDLCNMKFYVPLSYKTFKNIGTGSNYHFVRRTAEDAGFIEEIQEESIELEVTGIIRPKRDVTLQAITGAIGYLPSLSSYLVEQHNPEDVLDYDEGYTEADNNVIIAQKENPNFNVLRQENFVGTEFDYDFNSNILGIAEEGDPESIYIYPTSFNAKKEIVNLVNEYNDYQDAKVTSEYLQEIGKVSLDDLTEEEHLVLKSKVAKKQVTSSDTVGALLSSVEIIINAVVYVLIAFVSISLVVSSIMIGIITYVSVLERTKEIGVLRSLGASKFDITNVFNSETIIIGIVAGLLGVIIALILDIPISLIVSYFAEITLTAIVPWIWIIILPLVSMVLTIISGLIPAYAASKKDPVVALRTE